MKGKIRLGGFKASSVADGPGIRSVLFFQGCERQCNGCHNPGLQPGKGGRVLSPSAATDWLVKECHNRKLTISGGEPLEQREGLMQLVDALSALNFDICLYTGYETEQVPSEIVKNLRYLKTGQYRKNLSSTKRFVGSDNQRFFEIIQGGCTPCLREI